MFIHFHSIHKSLEELLHFYKKVRLLKVQNEMMCVLSNTFIYECVSYY